MSAERAPNGAEIHPFVVGTLSGTPIEEEAT
jgi:hypothetical protein